MIYQEDSVIFHNEINKFLKYDYVGAPWPMNKNDNKLGVGNGGFSLRSKSAMIKCLNSRLPQHLFLNDSTIQYMKATNSKVVPEDVYFSKMLIDYNLGNIPDRFIAQEFSQESVMSENPIGGHVYWTCDKFDKMQYIFIKIARI